MKTFNLLGTPLLATTYDELTAHAQALAQRGGTYAIDEAKIVAGINRLSPDFIWIGLGTPKQQDWIHRHKDEIKRGVLFAVGFAFDVNAGLKRDAPGWMQRGGLT